MEVVRSGARLAVFLWWLILGVSCIAWLRQSLRARDRERRIQLVRQSSEVGYRLVAEQKWSEAAAALDDALTLTVKHALTPEADLYFYKGYSLEQMQRHDEALSAYAACQACKAGAALRKYRPLAAFRRGYLLAQLRRWDEAASALQESIRVASQSRQPKLELSARRVLLRVCQAAGWHEQALVCIEEALSLTHNLEDESAQAVILDLAGDVHLALRQPEQALRRYEQSLDLFRKLSNAETGLVVQRDIGALYQAFGQWDNAFAWFEACQREAEHAQDLAGQARILYDVACLHIHREQSESAAGLLLRSMSLFRQEGDREAADQVGRTLIGLGVWMHRQATAEQMTYRDIQRGSATGEDGEEG
jgi:tetratricopeptide (TPR) repeat protein